MLTSHDKGHESIKVRAEEPRDQDAVREVHFLAFGRDPEGRLVDLLRAEGYVRVALVAEEAGRIVGHALFSALPIVTSGGVIEALALAPLAVAPAHQRRGIGSALVREGLRVCARQGNRIVVVLGHPEYYPRFGFSAERAERLAGPFAGPAFMVRELVSGALDGVEGEVRYPPPFESV